MNGQKYVLAVFLAGGRRAAIAVVAIGCAGIRNISHQFGYLELLHYVVIWVYKVQHVAAFGKAEACTHGIALIL